MKPKLFAFFTLALLATLNPQLATCFAQGTAFTYQGRLTSGTNLATGSHDLTFALFSVSSGAGQVGATITNSATAVSNGLFTVALDFGPGIFTGPDRWLEIAARTNGGGAFATLTPRQKITPSPYVIYAAAAGSAATATTANGVANNGVSSGAIQTGAVGATQIADGSIGTGDLSATVLSNTFWRLSGNTGTTPGTHFLGTTDNQPLEVKVNGLRALRVEPNTNGAPNLIGGSPRNFVGAGVIGAVLAGGGATNYFTLPYTNSVSANFGTIGGGRDNTIQASSVDSTISGGNNNKIQSNARLSTIGGGFGNSIQTNAIYSTIGGGYGNTIQVDAYASTIGGGIGNTIQTNALISTIGGGDNNTIQTNVDSSTIGGGFFNTIQTDADYSTIGGGRENRIHTDAEYSTIGGGLGNKIQVNTYASTIGGGEGNTIQTNATLSTIGGGNNNEIQFDADYSAISGGRENTIQTNALDSTIGGGFGNTIQTSANISTIGGGFANTIQTDADYSTIGGGYLNKIQINADYSTIGGGLDNTILPNAGYPTISGGSGNTILTNADYATIPGGYSNSATNRAFAAGTRAKANHTGSFVWADSTDADFATTGNDQFLVRASGGVGISTGGTERLRINSVGSVAIGIPGGSSDAALHVQNTVGSRPIKCDRVSDDGQLIAWARDDGIVGDVSVALGVVSYNAFTGSHYAWLPRPLDYGTLVTLTGENRRPKKTGEIVYGVTPTSRANDPACLGAYLAPHRNEEPAATTDQHQIMSVGNGEMWVTQSDTGDIRPGDYLISSEVAGCAMKDDSARFPVGHICARAAEAVEWSAVVAGANGRKQTRISVLFGNFVRDSRGAAAQNRSEALAQELKRRDAENVELKQRLEKLERLMSERTATRDHEVARISSQK